MDESSSMQSNIVQLSTADRNRPTVRVKASIDAAESKAWANHYSSCVTFRFFDSLTYEVHHIGLLCLLPIFI